VEEFLEFVVKQLVDYPDEVLLTKVENHNKVIFKLRMRQSDVGKVIGKFGHTISSIRNLLSAAAEKHGMRASVQIEE
jgi:predicted RNA-binding protein YlqC (UPF0109 family)